MVLPPVALDMGLVMIGNDAPMGSTLSCSTSMVDQGTRLTGPMPVSSILETMVGWVVPIDGAGFHMASLLSILLKEEITCPSVGAPPLTGV